MIFIQYLEGGREGGREGEWERDQEKWTIQLTLDLDGAWLPNISLPETIDTHDSIESESTPTRLQIDTNKHVPHA